MYEEIVFNKFYIKIRIKIVEFFFSLYAVDFPVFHFLTSLSLQSGPHWQAGLC